MILKHNHTLVNCYRYWHILIQIILQREGQVLMIILICLIRKNNGIFEFVIEKLGSHTKYFLNFRMHFHCITCTHPLRDLQVLQWILQNQNIITTNESVTHVIWKVFVNLDCDLDCDCYHVWDQCVELYSLIVRE